MLGNTCKTSISFKNVYLVAQSLLILELPRDKIFSTRFASLISYIFAISFFFLDVTANVIEKHH